MVTTQKYNDQRAWFLNKRLKDFQKNNQMVDIVQIGDSITEQWNLSRYITTSKVIINSGVGGDITDLLIKRIKRDCFNYHPQKIILMIGINDVRTYFTKKQFIERTNIEQLIKEVSNNIIKIITMCKDINLVWCEILPLNELELNSYHLNQIIDKINENVRQYIYNNKLEYVDILIFDDLIIYDGRLDSNCTNDGLHPNDDGYYLMSKKLETLLK